MNSKTTQPADNTAPANPNLIDIKYDGAIATIILNRPEKHNAISLAMWQEIPGIIRTLSENTQLRCIILRGAGEKAFSSGCDISEFPSLRANREQGILYGEAIEKALAALYHCPLPIIARVHGLCMGAGVELLATCDIRLCTQSSTFGIPAKNLAIVLSYAELEPLHHLLGSGALLEILLEGRTLSATEAREKNLITRIVPDEKIAEETSLAARRIIKGAPLAAYWHKKFVRRLGSPEPLTPAENAESFDCYDTEDYRAGHTAFRLRTPPDFKGK